MQGIVKDACYAINSLRAVKREERLGKEVWKGGGVTLCLSKGSCVPARDFKLHIRCCRSIAKFIRKEEKAAPSRERVSDLRKQCCAPLFPSLREVSSIIP